jgi:hypothetical protein
LENTVRLGWTGHNLEAWRDPARAVASTSIAWRWAERRTDHAGPVRDRLAGRTPRSERGNRGSTPCPGALGRVAQQARALVLQTRGRWFDSSLAHRVAVAQPVERPPETRGAAGSIPAGHTFGSVAQRAESPTLNRVGAGSTPAGAINARSNWKDCHWRGTPSRKRVGLRALGVRVPLLPLVEAWPSWEGSAVLRRRAAPAPQVRVVLPPPCSGVVEWVRRATVNREGQVRTLPPEPLCPRGRTGDDAGPSTRKLRVRVPPGVLTTRRRGDGHPAGFGSRRAQVRLLPARSRRAR